MQKTIAHQDRRDFLSAVVLASSSACSLANANTPCVQSTLPHPLSQRLPQRREPLVISGQLLNAQREPMRGVILSFLEDDKTTTTDQDGRFFWSSDTKALERSNFTISAHDGGKYAPSQDIPTLYSIVDLDTLQDEQGRWRLFLKSITTPS
jgi:hypothetical protein